MSDESTDNKHSKYYTLRSVTTPLPSQKEKTSNDTSPRKANQPHLTTTSTPPVRDINEDDDGYDPYSDYHEPSHLFEKDPWR